MIWWMKRAGCTQSQVKPGMHQPIYGPYLRMRRGAPSGTALPSRLSTRTSSPPLRAPTHPCHPQNGCHLGQASHKPGGEISFWAVAFSHTTAHTSLLSTPFHLQPATHPQAPSHRFFFNVPYPCCPPSGSYWSPCQRCGRTPLCTIIVSFYIPTI
jgi:hypothetical protein